MSFRVRIQLKNPGAAPKRVVIHQGTVFEVQDPFARVQNLVAMKPTVTTVPPGSVRGVEIETWCLNHHLAPPRRTPMRATVLAKSGALGSQDALWADMDNRR
jgi:hypothetical protein